MEDGGEAGEEERAAVREVQTIVMTQCALEALQDLYLFELQSGDQ